ncbi:hypothetical protein [Marinobacter sp. LN3S78]|uniref:hypothetical protein n=1 Tax=Marinobacter sp. LN3S78 TaxID=3382300 RepID=UPI00387AB3FD
MARNPSPERQNEHVFIAAKTGGGKSQLTRNNVVPGRGIRALIWDVDMDHKCQRFTDRGAFMRAVNKADKSGKPFKIGWSGDDSQETFIWFCEVAWAILDGHRETWVICEEMADLELGQRMPQFFGKLMKRGRKYGAKLVMTTQRCQEVPKAMITQPRTRFIGLHEDQDARYLERAVGISKEEIETLKPLQFWRKDDQGRALFETKYRAFKP